MTNNHKTNNSNSKINIKSNKVVKNYESSPSERMKAIVANVWDLHAEEVERWLDFHILQHESNLDVMRWIKDKLVHYELHEPGAPLFYTISFINCSYRSLLRRPDISQVEIKLRKFKNSSIAYCLVRPV